MSDFSQSFPQGMVYSVPYTTVPFVTQSLKEVGITLGIAFVLVAFVVFLFLQSWRATLIPIVAVAVSRIGPVAAVAPVGFSINPLARVVLGLGSRVIGDQAVCV